MNVWKSCGVVLAFVPAVIVSGCADSKGPKDHLRELIVGKWLQKGYLEAGDQKVEIDVGGLYFGKDGTCSKWVAGIGEDTGTYSLVEPDTIELKLERRRKLPQTEPTYVLRYKIAVARDQLTATDLDSGKTLTYVGEK